MMISSLVTQFTILGHQRRRPMTLMMMMMITMVVPSAAAAQQLYEVIQTTDFKPCVQQLETRNFNAENGQAIELVAMMLLFSWLSVPNNEQKQNRQEKDQGVIFIFRHLGGASQSTTTTNNNNQAPFLIAKLCTTRDVHYFLSKKYLKTHHIMEK